MQIRQLQVACDHLQDRLLLRVATQADEEYRIWLTRRFLRDLWPHPDARPAADALRHAARWGGTGTVEPSARLRGAGSGRTVARRPPLPTALVEKLQPARLERVAYGTPYSAAFDDVYHSALGGPAQARHVFLGGNELPQRWQGRERFVILETGFGTGLNFLTTWQAWRDDPQRCRRLHFVSFEKHPFTADDLAACQQTWPEFAELAAELQQKWPPLVPGMHRLHLDAGRVILTLVFGDAATQLRAVDASVDAFFLDGFSPPKNPELWSPHFCKGLARLTAPGATLATWTVAGHVRQALKDAEFDVEKRPGYANKRQMLVGRFRSRRPERHVVPTDRRAIIIGAGIAGSTTAYALAAAGWQVTVLEQAGDPGQGASSNLAGMLRPLPSADDNRLSRLTRAGFMATRALLAGLPGARWSPCGVLHLAREPAHESQQRRTVEQLGFPPELLQFVDKR
jgi:tRNA 5-methylaminomethyl-2-thiouridine biosynthesis bifunctional protein